MNRLKGYAMKHFLLLTLFTLMIFSFNGCDLINTKTQTPPPGSTTLSSDDALLKSAFDHKQTDIQVHGKGKVTKLLADDTSGSKHQRFILQLQSGQTLLIAHNIDISTKIDTLAKNDSIEFYGEYVWNSEGGLVHWTHHDPNGSHKDGYLKHKNITYD